MSSSPTREGRRRPNFHAATSSRTSISTDTTTADSFYSALDAPERDNDINANNSSLTSSGLQLLQSQFQSQSLPHNVHRDSIATRSSYAFSFSAYESAVEDGSEHDSNRHSRALSISTVTDFNTGIQNPQTPSFNNTNDHPPTPILSGSEDEEQHHDDDDGDSESDDRRRETLLPDPIISQQFNAPIALSNTQSNSSADSQSNIESILEDMQHLHVVSHQPLKHLHNAPLPSSQDPNSSYADSDSTSSSNNQFNSSMKSATSPESIKSPETRYHSSPESVKISLVSSPILHVDNDGRNNSFSEDKNPPSQEDFVFSNNFNSSRSLWHTHQRSSSEESAASTPAVAHPISPTSPGRHFRSFSLHKDTESSLLPSSDAQTTTPSSSMDSFPNSSSFNTMTTTVSDSSTTSNISANSNLDLKKGFRPLVLQPFPRTEGEKTTSAVDSTNSRGMPLKSETLNSSLILSDLSTVKPREVIDPTDTRNATRPNSSHSTIIPRMTSTERPLSLTSVYSETIPPALIIHPARDSLPHVYRSRSSYTESLSSKTDSVYGTNDHSIEAGASHNPSNASPSETNSPTSVTSVQIPIYYSPNIESLSKFPYRNSQMPGRLSFTSSPESAKKLKSFGRPISAFVTASRTSAEEEEEEKNSFPLQQIHNNKSQKINTISSSSPQTFFTTSINTNPFPSNPFHDSYSNKPKGTSQPPLAPDSKRAISPASLKFVRFNDSSLISLMERKDESHIYQDPARSHSSPDVVASSAAAARSSTSSLSAVSIGARRSLTRSSEDLPNTLLAADGLSFPLPSPPPFNFRSSNSRSGPSSAPYALDANSMPDLTNTDVSRARIPSNNSSNNLSRISRASSKNSRHSQQSRASRSERASQRLSKTSQTSRSSVSSISSYLLNTQHFMQAMLRPQASNSSLRQSLVSASDDVERNIDFDHYEDAVMGSVNVTEPEEMIVTTRGSPEAVMAIPATASGTILPGIPPAIAPPDAPVISRLQPAITRQGSRTFDPQRNTYSSIQLSSEDDANLAATARAANVITEKRSEKFTEKNEIIDEFGNVLCPPMLEWFLLFIFALFPILWLLLACGVFDKVIGKVSRRTKIIALVLAIALFVAAIAGLIVGLAVGLT